MRKMAMSSSLILAFLWLWFQRAHLTGLRQHQGPHCACLDPGTGIQALVWADSSIPLICPSFVIKDLSPMKSGTHRYTLIWMESLCPPKEKGGQKGEGKGCFFLK